MSRIVGLVIALVLCSAALQCLAMKRAVLPISATTLLNDHNAPRTAYGITALKWDSYLASNSQAWSNLCKFQHSTGSQRGQAYASARGVSYSDTFANSVGENLAANAGSTSINIAGWVNEKANWACSTNACASGKVCGHYTQIIWAQSLRVGCGASTCSVNSPFGSSWPTWNLLTCRYNPAGNWVGSHPLGSSAKCVVTPPAVWSNYGGAFQPLAFSGLSASGVTAFYMAGLGTTGTGKWSTNTLIRAVSDGAPGGRRIFASAVNANALGRVDALNHPTRAGFTELRWLAGGAGSGWVSLDNVRYSRKAHSAATLQNTWANYGSGYQGASFVNDAGAIFVSGLVKHTRFPLSAAVFTLPSTHRPSIREIFASLANNGYSRVDVLPTGVVTVVTATGTTGWVSLSNIRFRPSGTAFTPVPLLSGWVTYSSSYAPFGAHLGTDGRVFLRGLIKAGTKAALGTLPTGMRPALQRLFITASNLGPVRVDILPTGVVQITGRTPGTTSWPSWVSLSGIVFDPTPDTRL